jgi:hypothetical protein
MIKLYNLFFTKNSTGFSFLMQKVRHQSKGGGIYLRRQPITNAQVSPSNISSNKSLLEALDL